MLPLTNWYFKPFPASHENDLILTILLWGIHMYYVVITEFLTSQSLHKFWDEEWIQFGRVTICLMPSFCGSFSFTNKHNKLKNFGSWEESQKSITNFVCLKALAQCITISITRKFVSCNFSMDQLDLKIFGKMIYHLIHICHKSINGWFDK